MDYAVIKDDWRIKMGYAHFAPCPHCSAPLSFLEGAAGSSMHPECPCCHAIVPVKRAAFLMEDRSRPRTTPTKRAVA